LLGKYVEQCGFGHTGVILRRRSGPPNECKNYLNDQTDEQQAREKNEATR